MEKISGIIPATPRVVSVDLTDARPLRPGVPSFGRPVGQSSYERSSVKQIEDKIIGLQLQKLSLSQTPEREQSLGKSPVQSSLLKDKVTLSSRMMQNDVLSMSPAIVHGKIDETIMSKDSTAKKILIAQAALTDSDVESDETPVVGGRLDITA